MNDDGPRCHLCGNAGDLVRDAEEQGSWACRDTFSCQRRRSGTSRADGAGWGGGT